jgi:hypothetical protein
MPDVSDHLWTLDPHWAMTDRSARVQCSAPGSRLRHAVRMFGRQGRSSVLIDLQLRYHAVMMATSFRNAGQRYQASHWSRDTSSEAGDPPCQGWLVADPS